MSRIALDTQPLQNPQKTGHAYYVESLLAALKAQNRYEYLECAPAVAHDLRTYERFFWDQIQLPHIARKQKANLLCTTAFSVPNAWASRGMKRVAIIHDIALKRFPQNMKGFSGWFLRQFVTKTFQRADHLIAISEATKKDVVELLHIPAEKITVVHSGVDQFYQPVSVEEQQKVQEHFQLPKKFLLWVGTLEPRKNIPFLIRSLAPVLKDKNIPLVLVGKRGWLYEEIFQAIQETGTEHLVRELGYVSNEEKRALYSAASLFVYPSIYEGFGMPILEAQACGCPVLAANTSSLPIVAGNAGILLPLEGKLWEQKVSELLDDQKALATIAQAGLLNVQNFTWEKTAAQVASVFEKVLA